MGKKIIIAGAGHAAMMCGATLAKNGYDVTVYERRKRKDVGYPWFDCVNPDIFEMGTRTSSRWSARRHRKKPASNGHGGTTSRSTARTPMTTTRSSST